MRKELRSTPEDIYRCIDQLMDDLDHLIMNPGQNARGAIAQRMADITACNGILAVGQNPGWDGTVGGVPDGQVWVVPKEVA